MGHWVEVAKPTVASAGAPKGAGVSKLEGRDELPVVAV